MIHPQVRKPRRMYGKFDFKSNTCSTLIAVFWASVIPLVIPLQFSSSGSVRILEYIASFCGLFLVMIVLIMVVKRYRSSDTTRLGNLQKRWIVVGSILGCIAIWSTYWIIFYPGLISWDFYVQWYQLAGRIPYSDWHPVFDTLLMWAVTRLWFSPGMVTLVQIVTMSLLVGMVVSRLFRCGVSAWVVVPIALFYCFSPLNSFYAVSLWKDIAYSIAFLWFNILILDVVVSNGEVFANKTFLIKFFIALCFVAMIRHNGLVPVFGTLAVLLVAYRRTWLKSLMILLVSLISFILVFTGPVFNLIKVDRKDSNLLKAHLQIQQIGAVLNNDGNITEKDRAFLSQIVSLSYWKKAYDPHSCMPLIYRRGKDGKRILNWNFFRKEKNYHEFMKVWGRIALRNPSAILKYYLHATDLLWRIKIKYRTFVIPNGDLIEEDLFSGYKPSKNLNQRVGSAGHFLLGCLNDASRWFLCRGPLYFWLSLFFLSLMTLRIGKFSVLIIATPMLLQALTVAAFPLVQDTRFMFPIILVTPLMIGLFFSSQLPKPSKRF